MLSRFFIDRPIFATVVSLVIITVGLVSLLGLPIAQYPNLAPPTISVTAVYPGADAQVVADTVAAPIEQEVNGVEGMLYMSSVSAGDGSYTLTITFEPSVNLDIATVQVQNRVSAAEPRLPARPRRRRQERRQGADALQLGERPFRHAAGRAHRHARLDPAHKPLQLLHVRRLRSGEERQEEGAECVAQLHWAEAEVARTVVPIGFLLARCLRIQIVPKPFEKVL